MRYIKAITLLIVFTGTSIFILGCNPAGIKRLLILKENQKIKQELTEEQTANYSKVKSQINSANMAKGMSKEEALKRFGAPVISLSQDIQEKWVYKPAEGSWFTGEKIYLFFDKDGLLVHWDCVNCSP